MMANTLLIESEKIVFQSSKFGKFCGLGSKMTVALAGVTSD